MGEEITITQIAQTFLVFATFWLNWYHMYVIRRRYAHPHSLWI
jgi:hypothetical protein